MSTKFFTNEEENTLLNKFEGVFSNNPQIKEFDALVGYLRASGYFEIRKFIHKLEKVRILVGIDVDKIVKYASQSGLEFFRNTEKTIEQFLTEVHHDIQEAKYDKETEEGIMFFIQDIISKRIEIKAHPDKRIHAKVYIFRPEEYNKDKFSSVITGSSNLTGAGLGSAKVSNYEFNVILNDYDDVKFATDEFEKLWNEADYILPENISDLTTKLYFTNEVTPFELFIKLLIEYFGDSIDYDPDSIGDVPSTYKKLSYQIDAVNMGYKMLLQHNGFILADVVGLGKTVVAAIIANKFCINNGREITKILVVYPPAVENNWKDTFKDFRLDRNTKFISNGSLHKIIELDSDYWSMDEYDLVIVDESHKFRTHTTDYFDKLQRICKNGRKTIGMIGGEQKKVMLVSATPLNNRPDDILNQILLFQDARMSTLPKTNLTSFFAPLIAKYKQLKKDEKIDISSLREIYNEIRKYVIEPITVRRTRKDIENNDEYLKDITDQGIEFPKVKNPQKIDYIMNDKLSDLFAKTVFMIVKYSENSVKAKLEIEQAKSLGLSEDDKLTYNRYKAISLLKPDIQAKYYEKAELISKSLADIMKTQLVKRLESSFYALKISLKNFQKANKNMIDMYNNDKIFIAPDMDINNLIELNLSYEEIEMKVKEKSKDNPKNNIFKAEDFEPEFITGLLKDEALLERLINEWEKINYDPKFQVFKNNLEKEFFNEHNLQKKLIIFSESLDTVNYLSRQLAGVIVGDSESSIDEKFKKAKILSISNRNRNAKYKVIKENFDANYPSEKEKKNGATQKDDFNILITTEVLAEGVNLHRSNVIIHYDTPWNSTKMMQRIGRVNRIGTNAKFIYNYVFYPSAQGNSLIKLSNIALTKIQAFHTAYGEDNKIFSEEEILENNLVQDMYDSQEEGEDERLKYLQLLRQFRIKNKEWFKKIEKMPLKSRVCRNSKEIEKEILKNTTSVFLKTDRKFEFYLVDSNAKANEITAVDSFKIFEANKNESGSKNMIDDHYLHVNNALTRFEKVEIETIQTYVDPTAQGGIAMKAKRILNALKKVSAITEAQIELITKTTKLIDVGRYANLPNEIVKLDRIPDIKDKIKKFDEIAIKYAIESFEVNKSKKAFVDNPVLIISESFE